MAQATLPDSKTPWQDYVDNYDRIRDTMERVLEGFEDFNRRARHPHGFRIAPAGTGTHLHDAVWPRRVLARVRSPPTSTRARAGSC